MTKERNKRRKKEGKIRSVPSRSSTGQLIFSFMILFTLALIIRNSDIAIKYASEGLSLCFKSVIPALFPFMVLSDITVSSGATSIISRLLQKPMRFLFGVSGQGACSVILGMLCGFPVGARSALSVYDSGGISKSELERLLCFCNSPSSAFLISAVGVSLFGSQKYGVALYAITVISSVVTGIIGNLEFASKLRKRRQLSTQSSKYEDISSLSMGNFTTSDFTEAVSASALSMLKISAFVVFFTVFTGTLSSVLSPLSLSPTLNAFLFGFFELSSGVARSSSVSPTELGAILAAFCAGWSGISVHFQIMSICAGRNISFKPYFKAKFFQGLLCALMMKLYLDFFAKGISFNVRPTALFLSKNSFGRFDILSCGCFLIALFVTVAKFRRNHRK